MRRSPSRPSARRSKRRPTGRGRGAAPAVRGARSGRRPRWCAGPASCPTCARGWCSTTCATSAVGAHERAAAEAGRLLDGHGDAAPRRPHRRASSASWATWPSLRRRHRAHDARQGLLLRWVRTRDVRRALPAAGRGRPRPPAPTRVADVASCPGAEACRLAVTQSRGLGRQLADALRARPDLAAAPGLVIKISGCPNGCGQHHVAGIGFQGSVRRLGSRVPQYFVMVGGGVGRGGASFARLAAKVPARRAGAAVRAADRLCTRPSAGTGETAGAFFRRVDLARVKDAAGRPRALTAEDARARRLRGPGRGGAVRGHHHGRRVQRPSDARCIPAGCVARRLHTERVAALLAPCHPGASRVAGVRRAAARYSGVASASPARPQAASTSSIVTGRERWWNAGTGSRSRR